MVGVLVDESPRGFDGVSVGLEGASGTLVFPRDELHVVGDILEHFAVARHEGLEFLLVAYLVQDKLVDILNGTLQVLLEIAESSGALEIGEVYAHAGDGLLLLLLLGRRLA